MPTRARDGGYERVSAGTDCSLHRNTSELSVILAPDPTPSRPIEMCEECVSRKERKKERKISSTCGTRTHNLLLTGQGHCHCAMGELQMAGRGSELLSNAREYSVLLSGRDHECMSNMSA